MESALKWLCNLSRQTLVRSAATPFPFRSPTHTFADLSSTYYHLSILGHSRPHNRTDISHRESLYIRHSQTSLTSYTFPLSLSIIGHSQSYLLHNITLKWSFLIHTYSHTCSKNTHTCTHTMRIKAFGVVRT